MFKLVDNIVGLFIGENSKKRQIGLAIAGALMALHLFGVLDAEQFKLFMQLDGLFLGLAFSARMTKMTNQTIALKEDKINTRVKLR